MSCLCSYYLLDKSPWGCFSKEVLKIFSNARLYNAEDSQIYGDAVTMEAAFKSLPPPEKKKKKEQQQKQESSDEESSSEEEEPSSEEEESSSEEEESSSEEEESSSEEEQPGNDPVTERMQRAIAAIRACKERRRILSLHFEELPSRAELPDYYAIVKQPVDLQTIESRVEKG